MRRLLRFSIRAALIATALVAIGVAIVKSMEGEYLIVALPRPNSGEFSTAEATRLLPGFLDRSRGIPADHELITTWKGPTQAIRVHVDLNDQIHTTDFFGVKSTGLTACKQAVDRVPVYGNAVSVLLTAETSGWKSSKRQALVQMLFQPSIQVYLITRE